MYLCAECQPPREIIRMFTSHGPCEDCKRVTVCYNWPPGERPDLSEHEAIKILRRDIVNTAIDQGWQREDLEVIVHQLWLTLKKKGVKACQLEWVLVKLCGGSLPLWKE